MRKGLVLFFVMVFLVHPVFAQDVQLERKRAQLSQMYMMVSAIEQGQEIFFLEKGFYASNHDDLNRPVYNLCFSDNLTCRDNFATILGVEIPGNSPFAYSVADVPAKLYIKVIDMPKEGNLCYKYISYVFNYEYS